jgi:hypothetical protein
MKASGSYASLVRGVSQQVPQDRQPGQHTEQVNLIPDPVKGLTRRHGSRWVAEQALALDPADLPAMIADTANWRAFDYSNNGNDFVVLHRTAAIVSGSTLPPLIAFNRTTGQFLTYVRNTVDAQLDLLTSGGVSAITAIGKYVFMAGHTTVASATSSNLWADSGNQSKAVVWIRGGAYARDFTATATKLDNSQVTFTYKTPASSYPDTLDTSKVPVYAADPAGGTQADTEAAYVVNASGVYRAELSWFAWNPTSLTMKKGATAMTNTYPTAPASSTQFSWATGDKYAVFHSSNLGATDLTMSYTHTKTVTNPNYAKTVNDITNAFNSAVTNWIGTSSEAITPNAIAEQLRLAAVAAGLTTATRQQSTIIFDNVKGLTVQDGGDGTLIRGVANEVTNIDQVSDIHSVGKIVKVRTRNSKEAFYLKAQAQDAAITSGYTKVTWVEGAGVQHTITNALVYATVSGSSIYVASSATLLNTILPGTHPTYPVSTCGDNDSSPLPFFIGKKISYLGIFQDRLLIGAGAVLRCSKIGDYLNYFRSSVLTVPADDSLEMLSQGSEDDELRFSCLYDRDLVIFGVKRQYAITGRGALTPTSANMQVMSSHSNAADIPPLAVGSVIFYGQVGEKSSSVHQIQPGVVAESPESFIASSQIDTYLLGKVIELSNHAKPTHIFARTQGSRNSIYCFSYLDKEGQGRVQDAWGRWDFNEDLGPIIGMSRTPEGLLVYRLQSGVKYDASGSDVWVVADLCPLTTGLALYPYLDSIRPLATVEASTGATHPTTLGDWYTAFDSTSEFQFIGDTLANSAALVTEFPAATGPQVGALQPCYFIPTNPFVKDKNDKAITSGRLVITSILASLKDSSGFTTQIDANEGSVVHEYNGRTMGDINNLIGREPVTDTLQSIPIGRETREYTIKLLARKWFPFTLTTLEWIGQFYNRTQRF